MSMVTEPAKLQICAVGSCQSTMVAKYLRLNPDFADRYDIWAPAKQVYQMTDTDIATFHERLADVDILLVQPVTNEYRSPAQVGMPSGALSTRTLLSKIKPGGRELAPTRMLLVPFGPDSAVPEHLHHLEWRFLATADVDDKLVGAPPEDVKAALRRDGYMLTRRSLQDTSQP